MKDETFEKLNSVFGEAVSKYFTVDKLLLFLLEDKVKSLGISLTRFQRKKLISLLQEANFESISIQPNRQQKLQLKKRGLDNVNLEINDADVAALESKVFAIIKDVSKSTLDKTLNSISRDLVKEWKKQANPILKKLGGERQRFYKYNNRIWGKALGLLEALIDISLDTGAEFNEKYRPIAVQQNDVVFEVLTRLHARGCQVSSEILTLLRNGFADGAHARWRTLHELSVTAIFVAHHDNRHYRK